jgi:hypothetical protein
LTPPQENLLTATPQSSIYLSTIEMPSLPKFSQFVCSPPYSCYKKPLCPVSQHRSSYGLETLGCPSDTWTHGRSGWHFLPFQLYAFF